MEDVVPPDQVWYQFGRDVGVIASPDLWFGKWRGEAGGDAVLDLLDECVDGPVDGSCSYRHAERVVLNVNGGVSSFSMENVGFSERKESGFVRGRKIKVVCLTSIASQKPLRSVAEEDRAKEALACKVPGQRQLMEHGERRCSLDGGE